MKKIVLPSFQTTGTLTGNFFDVLHRVETAIPVNNLFVVKFDIPDSISDQIHGQLGESAADDKTNIDVAADLFKNSTLSENSGFIVCNGVKVIAENSEVEKLGDQINGYLPITVNARRNFDASGLSLQFMETVISVADFIFKPWTKLVAREGGFSDSNLHTNIDVLHLERTASNASFNFFSRNSYPKIRKQHTFYNCLPYSVQDDIVTYQDTPGLINREVQFHFDRYDIKLPTA